MMRKFPDYIRIPNQQQFSQNSYMTSTIRAIDTYSLKTRTISVIMITGNTDTHNTEVFMFDTCVIKNTKYSTSVECKIVISGTSNYIRYTAIRV